MSADALPVLSGVLRDQRRSLVLWGLAVAAVTAIYVSFYPAMGDASQIEAFIENLPEAMVQALGYDRMASPAGYLRSTVYGLLGPALLLVFAIGAGGRLIAGQEEDGTLELELTSPVARPRLLLGRLLALWLDIAILVAVITVMTMALVAALDIDVTTTGILAGSAGLLLLVIGLGTVTMAAGAATGRRAVALGVGAGLAVLSFMFDALGPIVDAGWMTAVSPFTWYLGNEPISEGFDLAGLALLALVPLIAGAVGMIAFDRRDLMVA